MFTLGMFRSVPTPRFRERLKLFQKFPKIFNLGWVQVTFQISAHLQVFSVPLNVLVSPDQMALDVTTSGTSTGTASGVSSINTSLSTTQAPSTTVSTTSSAFSSPSIQNKNGTIKNGYLTPNKFSRTTATTFGPLSPRHNMESSLSAKEIVLQLRQLAQDPHQQSHLIDNTESLRILSDSLLGTATRSSTETCIFSLQTLQLLASNPSYRDTLKSIPNLNARIDALCLSAQQRLQINAKNLRATLQSNTPLNKLQQWQPRPLHKIEFQVDVHREYIPNIWGCYRLPRWWLCKDRELNINEL